MYMFPYHCSLTGHVLICDLSLAVAVQGSTKVS